MALVNWEAPTISKHFHQIYKEILGSLRSWEGGGI